MAMTLQQAIDFAANPPPTPNTVHIMISMHDEDLNVLVGVAGGDAAALFRPDLSLLNLGTHTIAGGGAPLRGGLVPGFSTRGLGPGGGAGASLSQWPNLGQIPIDFSVRRDPGIPWLAIIGRGGPSVQIEIETWSGPAPAGTVTGGIKLDVVEDGALLRAVGPSLMDPALKASYTVTVVVLPTPG
jgi:hypothetical protein